jgi:multisubunit Na+/H+ antiporter MnhC subunit
VSAEEFQRALITVLIVGSIVIAIGATAVFLMLRGFGAKTAGSPRHVAVVASLIGFILLCCAALFALSYLAER